MTNPADNPDKLHKAPALRADPLAAGIVFMLSVTVVQRLLGFARSVMFCRFLEEDQLGQWSLAFSFLLLAAPLAVLGLPGTFGRYAEYYRSRGQLRAFLRRTTLTTLVLGAVAIAIICFARHWVAWIIFNDPGQSDLVLILGLGLTAMIAFNFLVELLTALRQVRAATMMQFISSVVFAALGVGLIWGTSLGAASAAIAYAGGCLVAAMLALPVLLRCWRSAETNKEPLAHRQLWSKLLPFAGWVWTMNLLVNLFTAADRWMIVHFSALGTTGSQALVGQYHSSRVVPMVLVGVAGMLGGVLLPYLSHDWEAGRKKQVSRRLNLALKLTSLSFTVIGAIVLLLSPLLFGWLLQGRYSDGLAVLPWTLVYCIWFSLIMVGQNYLWCAEKAKFSSLVMLLGLVVNVALNYLLLPIYGLLGAVLATSAANAASLALVYLFNRRLGMQIDRGVYLAAALPLLLILGNLYAAVSVALTVVAAIWGGWLLSEEEKLQLRQLVHQYKNKLFALVARRKPASV